MPAGHEDRRQECLQEMGIQRWYPRFVLPCAPASALPVSGASPVAAAAPSRAIPAVERPAPVETEAGPTAASAPEVVSATSEPVPSTIEPASAASEFALAEGKEERHFSFAYLPVSESLGVLVEIPYATRGRLQAPQRALLGRILEALSVPVQSGATPVIHFQWPLHEGGHLENTLENARQTVEGFLRRQLKERPVRYLLAFCPGWPDYLIADTDAPTSGLLDHPLSVEVVVTRSLQEMLDDESLKRPVWGQLQQLKSRLVGKEKKAQ